MIFTTFSINNSSKLSILTHHIEICARKCDRVIGTAKEPGPRNITVKTGEEHQNKMAISMVAFVFLYVFLMRILYKMSGLLAEWVSNFSCGLKLFYLLYCVTKGL